MNNSEEILRVDQLSAGYGRIDAVREANLEIRAGEAVGLVGRNGAGKTTLISALAGLLPARARSISLVGTDISKMPPNHRVHRGLALVPSGGRLFKSLTVAENLTIGGARASSEKVEDVYQVFPELIPIRHRHAGHLSGGERQMVAIGRALLLSPSVLLLDEPSEGLAPIVVLRLARAINALRAGGMAILLAEQNMKFTDLVCQRWYEITKGEVAPLV